jgi:hypothetical protein
MTVDVYNNDYGLCISFVISPDVRKINLNILFQLGPAFLTCRMSSLYVRFDIKFFSTLSYSFQTQKDIKLQVCTRPYGSRRFMLPERLGSRHVKVVKAVSFTHRPPLHLRR